RREGDARFRAAGLRQRGFDFGHVRVRSHSVGEEILVRLGVAERAGTAAAGAGDAALGVDDDAKSGVTGAGRGGASAFGYAETNEDLFAYGMASHPHVPEIETALTQAGGAKASVAFTPHLVSMSRGLLATCYAR